MDPTHIVYTLLKLSKVIKEPLSVIPAIEKAVSEGAILDENYVDQIAGGGDYQYPIYYGIYRRCDIEIIKTLHKHWWDINKIANVTYIYREDINVSHSIIFQRLSRDGHVFFNVLYTTYKASSCINEKKYIESILDFFKPNIIYDDELRHIYLLEYEEKNHIL